LIAVVAAEIQNIRKYIWDRAVPLSQKPEQLFKILKAHEEKFSGFRFTQNPEEHLLNTSAFRENLKTGSGFRVSLGCEGLPERKRRSQQRGR
jgi:hypothetical protein